MRVETEGPFVTAATLCDQVIEGKDGVLSLIRLVDRWTITASGPEPPEEMPSQQLNLTLVVSLKAGAARGSHTVKIQPEAPSGLRQDALELPVLFEAEDRGQNLIVNLDFTVKEPGLYWFDVLLGDRRLTRIPLRVVYQRIRTGSQP